MTIQNGKIYPETCCWKDAKCVRFWRLEGLYPRCGAYLDSSHCRGPIFLEDLEKKPSKVTVIVHQNGKFREVFNCHAKKSIWQTTKEVYLDLGDGNLLHVLSFWEGEKGDAAVYDESKGGWYSPNSKPWGGWGKIVSRSAFLKGLIG